jgi:dTDP-4-amino-4,6-dideoxygalactose transaminase
MSPSINGRVKDLSRLRGYLADQFAGHRYVYVGLSGTTLFHEVLKNQPRRVVVLPAFMCPYISAAARLAGKDLIHIDADRQTQLPNPAQLERYLETHDASDILLMLDHSFGYPFPDVARLRARFPELVIFEDCARALGLRIKGHSPGEHSDYVLLSMYKTIGGSRNGAVLLSRTPLPIPEYGTEPVSFRERVAAIGTLRSIYHVLQRHSGLEIPPPIAESEFPHWIPAYGSPSSLCISRFMTELGGLETRTSRRMAIAEELSSELCAAGIDCVRASEGYHSAGHFVSIRVQSVHLRDQIATELSKKGFLMSRTWDVVSSRFSGFRETFPFGNINSEYLAAHMLHLRVRLFPSSRHRRRLVRELASMISYEDLRF